MSKRLRSLQDAQLLKDDDYTKEQRGLPVVALFRLEVQQVLDNLSNDELEMAARACYGYVQHPSIHLRQVYASRICQRYLESKKGNVDLATQKVQATLQFRKEYDLEGLMTAFDNDDSNNYAKTHLKKELSHKKFFVQGYDKQGRSTLFFIPRRTRGFDKEWHLKESLYSIERAIACSKCHDHTINAVVDFSGFSLTQHCPPMDIGKEFLKTLRSHYAGQIHKIFLLDCPTSFFILWKVFSQFVGTDTRNKIELISGEFSKKTMLTNMYSLEEMPPFMCPGGGKVRDLDLEEYLFETRFDEAFDECPQK